MYSRYDWQLGSDTLAAVPGSDCILDEVAELQLVEVRRGGSCGPIVLALERGPKCEVTGPPGCGKSSSYVSALAVESGKPVIHLVPHPRLVEEFVCRGYPGCTVTSDLSELFTGRPYAVPPPRVVVATYTDLLSRSFREGIPIQQLSLRPIYYCDECHESDAATYAVVRQFKSRRDKHVCVFVSATLEGGRFAVRESSDSVMDEKLPYPKSSQEFACSVRRTLERHSFVRQAIIFIDDGYFRLSVLKEAVESLGYGWVRLTSRTDSDSYGKLMTESTGQRVVFCLDSSYRSGFNFPVTLVIDSSVVSYRRAGDPEKLKTRPAFEFELYQARGRLARVPLEYQARYVYARFALQTSNDLALIEGYEGIIAAHSIHAQGHALPCDLATIGIRPKDGFLRDYRLLSSGGIIRTDDLLVSRNANRVGSLPSSYVQCVIDDTVEPDELLARFGKLNTSPSLPIVIPNRVGKFITMAGTSKSNGFVTSTFPNGNESVELALNRVGLSGLLTAMSDDDVQLVGSYLVETMNNLSCEFHAANAFATWLENRQSEERSSQQHNWLREQVSGLGLLTSKYASKSKTLRLLAESALLDVKQIDAKEFKDVIVYSTSVFTTAYLRLANRWQQPEYVADVSRDRLCRTLAVNVGFDTRGNYLIDSDNEKNKAIVRKISEEIEVQPGSKVQTGSGSVTGSRIGGPVANERSGPINKDPYDVDEYRLSVYEPDLAYMQIKYPNTKFSESPIRMERERRRAGSTAGSRSSGSKGSFVSGNSLAERKVMQCSAKTWKPPG